MKKKKHKRYQSTQYDVEILDIKLVDDLKDVEMKKDRNIDENLNDQSSIKVIAPPKSLRGINSSKEAIKSNNDIINHNDIEIKSISSS